MPSSTSERYPQLLSLAVHELRTPASVVGGYLRMLQREADEGLTDRQRKMVEEAEKSCARLVELIAELSDVSKFDSGVIALAHQPLDLFALVSDVAALVHEARDRDVRLEVRGADDRSTMTGDAKRLRSAFDAIFRALLREKAGPCLVIAERRHDTRDGRRAAVVVVAEAGHLQTASERDRVMFDEQRGGLGLALPLARRVIEAHGGGIWAPAPAGNITMSDDPVSRGSAIVTIPLAES